MRDMEPATLSNLDIQALGETYLQLFDVKKINLFARLFQHHNHAHAKVLMGYHEYKDPLDKWDFLADIYAKLPNNNGYLAQKIRDYFTRAFGAAIHIGTFNNESISGYATPIFVAYKTCFVADELKAIAKDYFAKNRHLNKPCI